MALKIDDAEKIVVRMKEYFGVESHAELARRLDIPKGTVTNWVQRNSVPYEACARMVLENGADLKWLLIGENQTQHPRAEERRIAELEAGKSDNGLGIGPERSHSQNIWRVLELMEFRAVPLTEVEIGLQLRLPTAEIQEVMMMLYRRRLVRKVSNKFELVSGAMMRADSKEEVAAATAEIRSVFDNEMLRGALDTRGVVALGETRVVSETPGETIMTAIRDTVAKLNDPAGQLVKIIIGVAPGEEIGINTDSGAE